MGGIVGLGERFTTLLYGHGISSNDDDDDDDDDDDKKEGEVARSIRQGASSPSSSSLTSSAAGKEANGLLQFSVDPFAVCSLEIGQSPAQVERALSTRRLAPAAAAIAGANAKRAEAKRAKLQKANAARPNGAIDGSGSSGGGGGGNDDEENGESFVAPCIRGRCRCPRCGGEYPTRLRDLLANLSDGWIVVDEDGDQILFALLTMAAATSINH